VGPEPISGIRPGRFDLESRAQKEIAHAGEGVFVTVLSVDALVLFERNFQTDEFDLDRLIEGALKMHLDTRTFGVLQSDVAERIKIEVTPQFAVDAR